MLMKYRYVGSTASNFTNGTEYYVIGTGDSSLMLFDDQSKPASVNLSDIRTGTDWTLVSLSEIGAFNIYP